MTLKNFAGLALAVGLTAALATHVTAQPKGMTLGTASQGGTYFIYGGVVASLLTEKLGTNVSTQQTQGPNQNVQLIEAGQIELGMTTMGVALQAWEGTGDWTKGKKHNNIRALFPMYDTPFQCIALKKSGVTKLTDLNGKTIGLGPKAGTPGTYYPLMMEALNIKVTSRFGQANDMAGQLGDGIIDAFCFAAGLPIASFTQIETSAESVFFTFTDEQIATLKQKMPELSDAVIPKATYKSQTADQKTVGLYNFGIASKDLPNDVAYNIVKAVLENNPRMVAGHSAAKETIIDNVGRNAFLPFHPGAVKYYQEKGIKLNDKVMPK